jgi:hypothetical protein
MEEFAKNLLRLVRGQTTLLDNPELIEVIPILRERNPWKLKFALQDEFIRLFPLLEGPTSLEVDWLDYRVEFVTSDLCFNLTKELESLLALKEIRAIGNGRSVSFGCSTACLQW